MDESTNWQGPHRDISLPEEPGNYPLSDDQFVKIGYFRLRIDEISGYKPGRFSKAQYIQKFGYIDQDDPGYYFEVYMKGQKDPILFRAQQEQEVFYLQELFDRQFAPVDWSLPDKEKFADEAS